MKELVKDNDKIVIYQIYGNRYNASHNGYTKFKKGKEYWLPVFNEVLATKRANGGWGFGHKPCAYRGISEMRSSPKRDEYMKCTQCGEKFPARSKLEELAKASFPDEMTIRFLVGLS